MSKAKDALSKWQSKYVNNGTDNIKKTNSPKDILSEWQNKYSVPKSTNTPKFTQSISPTKYSGDGLTLKNTNTSTYRSKNKERALRALENNSDDFIGVMNDYNKAKNSVKATAAKPKSKTDNNTNMPSKNNAYNSRKIESRSKDILNNIEKAESNYHNNIPISTIRNNQAPVTYPQPHINDKLSIKNIDTSKYNLAPEVYNNESLKIKNIDTTDEVEKIDNEIYKLEILLRTIETDPDAYYIKFDKKEIERKISDLKLQKAKTVRYEDKFLGQTKANYVLGRLSQDNSMLWNNYLDNPTPENKEKALMHSEAIDEYVKNNSETLANDGTLPWISQSLANYFPQFIDQTKAQFVGGIVGGAIGSAVGLPGAGINVGRVLGSGAYSYKTMRGTAFKALLDAGVDEEIARAAANDEAVISSIIEMGGEIITMGLTGSGKIADILTDGASKSFVDGVTTAASDKLSEALAKYGIDGAKKQVLTGIVGYLSNIASEAGEEASQELVSIANERRALNDETGIFNLFKSTGSSLFSLTDEDLNRIVESAKGGASVAAIMGGFEALGSNIISNKISNNSQDNFSQTGAEKLNEIKSLYNTYLNTNFTGDEDIVERINLTIDGLNKIDAEVNDIYGNFYSGSIEQQEGQNIKNIISILKIKLNEKIDEINNIKSTSANYQNSDVSPEFLNAANQYNVEEMQNKETNNNLIKLDEESTNENISDKELQQFTAQQDKQTISKELTPEERIEAIQKTRDAKFAELEATKDINLQTQLVEEIKTLGKELTAERERAKIGNASDLQSVQNDSFNEKKGRLSEEKAATRQKAFKQQRTILSLESYERRKYLSDKFKEHETELSKVKIGDVLVDNNENVIGAVSSKDELGFSIALKEGGLNYVLNDTFTDDFVIDFIEMGGRFISSNDADVIEKNHRLVYSKNENETVLKTDNNVVANLLINGNTDVKYDGIRYTITRTASGYYTDVTSANDDGYIIDARSAKYHGGPFTTREEAVNDLVGISEHLVSRDITTVESTKQKRKEMAVTTANDGNVLILAKEVANGLATENERNNGNDRPAQGIHRDYNANVQGNTGLRDYGGDDRGIRREIRQETWDNNGRNGVLSKWGASDNTGNNSEEEAANGRENIRLQESSQWNDGKDSIGESGRMGEKTRRNQSWKMGTGPRDSEAINLAYGEEKVTAYDLGISGGDNTDGVYIVVGGETSKTRAAKAIAAERGLELTLFAGGDLSVEGKKGIQGLISGNKVFVRVDDIDFTSEQIMRHEVGHDMIANGEIDIEEVKNRIEKTVGKGNSEFMARLYALAYSDMLPDEIWEEIICDSLGDMNIFANTLEGYREFIDFFLNAAKKEAEYSRKSPRGPPANTDINMSRKVDSGLEGTNNAGREMGNDRSRWISQTLSGEQVGRNQSGGRKNESSLYRNGSSEQRYKGNVLHQDNEGREISKENLERLKGTAITDFSGQPLAVYHGTTTDFDTFAEGDIGFHFGNRTQAEKRIYDKISASGRIVRAYLNIKKPLKMNIDIMNWHANSVALNLWNEGIFTKSEYDEIYSLWQPKDGYDSEAAIRLRELLESKGYDGIAYPNGFEGEGTSYIALHDEQIIRSDGEKPRFSMKVPVEVTDTLVALHNIDETKLKKALDLGGLPMPSIAVTKADIAHTNFGDITLVMSRDTVDPKVNRKNEVYSADIWSPTFPDIEYEANEEVENRIRDKYYEIAEKYGYDAAKPLYRFAHYLDKELNVFQGEEGLFRALYKQIDLMKLYLIDTGKYDEILGDKAKKDVEKINGAVRKAAGKDYEKWIDGLFKGAEKSRGIWNNKGMYTASGNRRSFKQTHYEVTLDNIVKAMVSRNKGIIKNNGGFYGIKSLRAGVAKRFSSIEDMHNWEGRLNQLSAEEIDRISEVLDKRTINIIEEIYNKKEHGASNNSFIEFDNIGNILVEIAQSGKYTIDNIVKILNKYGYRVGNGLAKEIEELLFDASQMPVQIFEAKPKRVVDFSEILAAVLPNTASEKLEKALTAKGINVLRYEAGNTEDRLNKINSVEGAKFSRKPNLSKLQAQKEMTIKYQNDVDKILAGTYNSSDALIIGYTPQIFEEIGMPSLPFVIGPGHVYSAIKSEAEAKAEGRYNKNSNYHGLGVTAVKEIYEKVQRPVMIIASKDVDKNTSPLRSTHSVVAIIDIRIKNNSLLLPIEITANRIVGGVSMDVNMLSSAYEKNAQGLIREAIAQENSGNVGIYYAKKEATALIDDGFQLPKHLQEAIASGGIIHSFSEKVNMIISDATESQQFKRWFGDWQNNPKKASKVVNKDGTPKVVFHGTLANGLHEFSKNFIGSRYSRDNRGFFFIDNQEIAEEYAVSKFDSSKKGEVLYVYLNVRKPLVFNSKYATQNGYGNVFKDKNVIDVWDRYHEEIFDEIDNGDYDGIILDDGMNQMTVVFEPEQIKSATDNLGTFHKNNTDIRYSRKPLAFESLEQENKDLKNKLYDIKKELAKKEKQAEYWKNQTKRTKAPKLREEDIMRLSKSIIKDYDSIADFEDINKRIKALGEFIIKDGGKDIPLLWDDVKDKAIDIARDVINNASVLVEDENSCVYREIKKVLKTKMSISQKDIISMSAFKDFRNEYKGRINIGVDNGGVAIDVIYKELSLSYPWLFSDGIAAPYDQLMSMAEAFEDMTPVYENPYNSDMAQAIEYCANDIIDSLFNESIRQEVPTFADKQAEKLEKQKTYGKERTREALAKVREQRDRKITALKDHYKEMANARRERKTDSEARSRLLKIARRLSNKKLPTPNRALLNQYIGNLDLTAKGITGKTLNKLSELESWYNDQKENNPDFISDKHTEKVLERLRKKRISDLSQQEVLELTNVLLNIENEIRTQRKFIESKEKHDTYTAGLQVIADIESSKGRDENVLGNMDKLFVENTLSPVRAVRRIIGYVDNSPLYVLTNELADGQRKMFDYKRRANEGLIKWTEDKAFVKRIIGKDAEEIEITGETIEGKKTVKITPAMRMSLYLHSLNDDNLRHIAYGGITIPNIKLYKEEKIEAAYDRGVTLKLMPAEIRKVVAQMTDKERAFALAASKYFNDMSKDSINEVSEKLKGYSLAQVDNYFPINTDKSFLKADFDAIKFDGTIEGMGFLKERIGALGPIMLIDINSILTQSIDMHAKYVGLAIPIRNFNKLWGVTKVSFNADGSRNYFESSIQKAIKQKWGSSGYKYIEKMMSDLQKGSKEQGDWDKLFSKGKSNYAKAVLTLNASVAMKQAASYPTAGAVVGFRPLAKAMLNIGKVDLDLINKYTPLLWYRTQGFSTQELGDMVKQGKSLPKALNWVQGIDILTTRKLWKAAEYYVKENNKILKAGTDEYYKAVAEVYNRIIEETQPNYTTMQRPQFLRSDNMLLQGISMFKTQPFQNFNILYDALGNLEAKREAYINSGTEESKRAYNNAKKGAYNAVWSQVMQAAVFAGMTMAWSIFRGKMEDYEDENGNMTVLSILSDIGKDMVANFGTGIPFGSEIWELISSMFIGETYYGIDEITVSAIDDFANSILKAGKSIEEIIEAVKDKDEINWREQALKLDSIVDAASKLAGIPYENVVKIFNAVFRKAAKAASGPYQGEYLYLKLTTSAKNYPSDYYNNLYEAYLNDKEAYEAIYEDMVDSGSFTKDKIKDAMENRMKDSQGVKEVKDLESRYLNPKEQREYDESLDFVRKSEIWDNATRNQRNNVEELIYGLVTESDSSQVKNAREKISEGRQYGITQDEYILYKLALSVVDKPSKTGKYGSYTNDEVEKAINLIDGLTDIERAYLWDAQGKNEKTNPYR